MSPNITLSKTGDSKIEVKKSVFIGRSFHITSPEEAAEYLAQERKKYPDARHLCYAWVIGGENSRQKSSDDGEPQGTAGQPLLELLGTGGLRRAYTDSGRLALEAGEPVTLIPALKWRRNCSYPAFEMLSRKASSSGWTVENIEYGQDVAFDILVPEEAENDIKRYCLDLTGGTLVLEDPDKLLMKGPKVPLS